MSPRLPMMPGLRKAGLFGLGIALCGIIASVLPHTARLETDIGLAWLFQMRGTRMPPSELVIAAIDSASATKLGVPHAPRKWPRALHARLVRNLSRAGASVIVFDIFFEDAKDSAQDHAFAEAMRETGNVVLFEFLTADRSGALQDGNGQSLAEVSVEHLIPPTTVLAQTAAGLAPFPLPRVPHRVNEFWLFKPGAGDVPTLPMIAFQVHTTPFVDAFLNLLEGMPEPIPINRSQKPGHNQWAQDPQALAVALRALFRSHPGLAAQLDGHLQKIGPELEPAALRGLRAILQTYGGADSRYLDFYGPAGTINTISYHRLLKGPPYPVSLRGKAVLVGFSERFEVQREDYFHTVFSGSDGVYLSGVEIAATALGNLLEHRSIHPPSVPAGLFLIAAFGSGLGILLMLLPAPAAIPIAGMLAAAYFGSAGYAFHRDGLWLPLIVPVVVQAPLALVGALLWHYSETQRERRRIQDTFGYYLPPRVVAELANKTRGIMPEEKILYGVCLATDAEQYTALSETLAPAQLKSVLDRYYEVVFAPVLTHGGFVSDVIGDAMLAIWARAASPGDARAEACRAALEILAAVERFNRRHPDTALPTRIGLHWGEMLLGSVGAGEHYEYRAIGDIVNSATRIEKLNKLLGTRVLASQAMVDGINGQASREVGAFLLHGKSKPLVVYELQGAAAQFPDLRDRDRLFAEGLAAFRSQRWHEAKDAFQECAQRYADGPARFYLPLCERFQLTPPMEPFAGIIDLRE